METQRKNNYDLLRIVSCLAVVMIHVSVPWLNAALDAVKAGTDVSLLSHSFITCIYNAIPRFAVPSFVMLSGGFILDSSETKDYKRFYTKKILKIGIPTMLFILFYMTIKICGGLFSRGGGGNKLLML